MMTPKDNLYLERRPRLLREFDRDARLIRPALAQYIPREASEDLTNQARREYAELIPQLPDLGGKEPFTRFLISTAELLAVYRTVAAHGLSLAQTGELVFEIGRAYLSAVPAYMPRLLGFMNFSPVYLNRLRKRAIESHARRYPDGYVFDYIPGDGATFDYGVDYLECGSCKFLDRQGASEFAPYICPSDILYSDALGWGLARTMTLAEGAPKCDFRFKRGGPTRVAVPDALRPVIERYRKEIR